VRLKYQGVHQDGVDIPELASPDRPNGHVDHGEIIEVDDTVGKRLAESADWQVTSRTKKGDEE